VESFNGDEGGRLSVCDVDICCCDVVVADDDDGGGGGGNSLEYAC